MHKIVILGYYGFENMGDEAVLSGILLALRDLNRELEITVLSNQPEVTADRYQVQAVSRTDLKMVLKTIASCDLFVSGGGSLLQDITGQLTIPYYLGLVFIAQMLGKKTTFYAQGVGPVSGIIGKKLIKWIGNRTELITVRDRDSGQLLVELGVNPELIVESVDPVFNFTPDCFIGSNNMGGIGDELFKTVGNDRPVIGISVRSWADNEYLDTLARVIDNCEFMEGAEVVIVPMHYDHDLALSNKLSDKMDSEALIMDQHYSPREMLKMFTNFDLFIGVRLHSLIFAAINRVPFVGISYDPKVKSFLHSLDLETGLTTENCSYRVLKETIEKTWSNRDNIADKLEDRSSQFHDLALENARRVLELL